MDISYPVKHHCERQALRLAQQHQRNHIDARHVDRLISVLLLDDVMAARQNLIK